LRHKNKKDFYSDQKIIVIFYLIQAEECYICTEISSRLLRK